MHIGIDASRIAVSERTGTEHYAYELLCAIAAQDRRSDYTLYCNAPPAALPPLGANFRLRVMPFARLWTHARLSAELLAHPPDVLFVPAHVLPLGVPLLRHTRTVVTIHDLGYLHFPQAHTPAHRLYLRLSTAWSARAATRVIAISAATRADLVRHARIAPAKISVIHHGLAPRFRPADAAQSTAVQAKYGISAPYFLYVGTVQPRKNLVRLIEAFAQLRIEGQGLRTEISSADDQAARSVRSVRSPQSAILVLAGKRGWRTEAIEQRAAALGIADAVRFTGYVADDDLPALLGGALAFVFPSLYEGFGMPVLEAMACGAPVLTATTSALPEVAGDAALLVDPADTAAIAAGLRRLATDTELRAELRARGLRRAALFTWARCATETLGVLRGD